MKNQQKINKESVLAVSGGRTDIRIRLLVVDGQSGFYTIGSKSTVAFHQWLRGKEIDFDHPEPDALLEKSEVDFRGGAFL